MNEAARTLITLNGERYVFESIAAKCEFMKNELSFWKAQHEALKVKNKSAKHQAFENLANSLAVLRYQIEVNENDFIYDDQPEESLSDVWLYSESPATRKWLELHAQQPKVAEGFYDGIFLGKSEHLDSFDHLTGYLAAYEFKLPLESAFAGRAAAQTLALRDVHSKFFKAKARLTRKAEKELSTFSDWHKTEEAAWTQRLNTLEATYREKLRLEGPATYWAKKASEHQTRGYIWTGVLGVILFVSVIWLWTSFNIWLSGARTPVGLSQIEGALIFVSLLSTLAFTVRTLSKLIFSAFHLQRDAEEREQLTHLYLSLNNDTQVDEESRKIILQSLFSRSETGLISNESGPTMPGLTDLLSTLKKG